MTCLALLPQLALVNIRMAIRTLTPHVRKDHADMAGGARNTFVKPF